MESKKPAPVLTIADQKRSISGMSSKTKRKTVLYTLKSPFELNWPLIGNENEDRVRALLGDHLGAIRSESVSVSRQTIKDIPREKRAQWRKDMKIAASNDESVNLAKQKMKDLAVGFRDVMDAITKSVACVVLCDINPNPPILTKLLQPLCKSKEIPILAIKDFASLSQKLLKIPRCLTIALKVSAKEEASCLHAFYKEVMDICQSSGLMNVSPFGPASLPDIISTSCSSPHVTLEQRDGEDGPPAALKQTPSCNALVKPVIAEERFYLKKMGRGYRFVPGLDKNPLSGDVNLRETQSSTATGGDEQAGSFIALTTEPVPDLPSAHNKFRYHNLKPVRPNENKKAGKNNKFKKNKKT